MQPSEDKVSGSTLKIMKKTILFLSIVALLLASCTTQSPQQAAAPSPDTTSIILTAIAQRHSVRHFTTEAISPDTLQLLARAGMAAPTACNKQPWAILAIDDRTTLDTLYAAMHYRDSMAMAPAALVVCGDMYKTLPDVARDFWIQDCSAMTENILLAAHACGLGAVWTGVYPLPDRLETVRNTLDLPDNITPLCVILVGHPLQGADHPKDKWLPDNYHYNRW